MDVLRRAAIAKLQTVLRRQGPLHAQARFYVGIGLDEAIRIQCFCNVAIAVQLIIGCTAQSRECPEAQSCRQLPARSHLPLVVQPEGIGPGITLLALVQQVDVPLCRHQLQVRGLKTIDETVLLHFDRLLAAHGVRGVEDVDTHVALEVAIDELCVSIMAVIEGMQPVGRSRGVAPLHAHQILQPHDVTSSKERQRQHVLTAQPEVQSQVRIVEAEGVVAIFVSRFQEDIQVGTAPRNQKRRASLLDGALGHDLGRQQADGATEVIVSETARTGADVKYRSRATAQLGRQQSLIERGSHHSIVVERRKQSHHVADIIDGSPIQQYQVLGSLSTTHLITARGFAFAFYARQQL